MQVTRVPFERSIFGGDKFPGRTLGSGTKPLARVLDLDTFDFMRVLDFVSENYHIIYMRQRSEKHWLVAI